MLLLSRDADRNSTKLVSRKSCVLVGIFQHCCLSGAKFDTVCVPLLASLSATGEDDNFLDNNDHMFIAQA